MFLGRVFVAVVVVVVLQSRQRATATSTMLGQTFSSKALAEPVEIVILLENANR